MSVRDEGLRRRRRLVWLGAVGLAVVVAAIVLVALPSKKSSRLSATEGSPTSTSESSDSTTVTTDIGQSTTTAVGGGQKPTTTVARRATTTIAPSTTTTELPPCTAADLDGTTSTDKDSYPSGAVVTVSVTLRNHSNHVCDGYVAYYQDRPVSITDESGAAVWSPPGQPPGLGVAHRPNPVPPGSSFTFITVQWDQRTCDSACASDMQGGKEGSLVRPGTYVAHGGYSAGNSGRLSAGQASFAVTAA